MDPKKTFLERLPYRPYCTDIFSKGLLVRPTATAVSHRYIQPNPPEQIAWLVFDVDRDNAALAWEDAGLPPPTITVVNPANGHAHLFYGLQSPVATGPRARQAPIRFCRAIIDAFRMKLKADLAYPGLVAKNPLHETWRVVWIPKLYELGELHEYVELVNLPSRSHEDALAGRNSTLFDRVRRWAYTVVVDFKQSIGSAERWQEAVIRRTAELNDFEPPLPASEVRSIGKSVARGTWRGFDAKRFSEKQAARGRKGGRPKTTADTQPWIELGIGRSTYYRKLKEGKL